MIKFKHNRAASFAVITFVYIIATVIGVILYRKLELGFALSLLIADVGATEYLANYVVKGTPYTIPDVLYASFSNSELTDYQLQHLNDSKGYVFVTFMFHNLGVENNMSQVIYPGFQSGGIINAKDLPKNGSLDTTHEYIELDVGIPGVDAGKAYLYNVKYDPTTK